ncbi:Rieske 2Fe-2S domain-containing protein [Tunturiibacter lichenicola]|uniref:Rieske 2Fe-2S domain-containing protein n=1 Tax=Tunturiibacter lichenicola TaxID=2051959 RepID=UPI0021B4A616|nr:Rieske 2Fe-2S domain-containing protein [Edaphobacter lichenicola]
MSELVRVAEVAGPPTELIFGDWYPALRTSALREGKTAKAMLLGVPLLLGRKTGGKLFAMRDLCPHRGIPLSAGWFDGETVTCKYHGWRFEPCSGQCKEIPSLTSHETLDPTKIYASAFPCEERDGFAWVYVPAPGAGRLFETGRAGEALPPVPEVPKFSAKFRSAHLVAELPCNVDHGIIGLMDPAHGPFVHQAWWWRSRASIHEKTKHFEPLNDDENNGRNAGFRMSSHAPSANSAPYKLLGVYGEPITTTIDFVLPNRRYETIRAGDKWFASLTTVTPITPSSCRIDVMAAWNVFYHVPFVTSIATFFGARFVRQDQQTMVEQAEGLRFNPGLMLIDDADKPAKWYFALKQARLKGTGEHPLSGPVTLHWRS